MSIDSISNYQPTTSSTTSSKAGNSLQMEDFFKLLVAQLSNQDMNNTMDDTQFISQMAQFSMVQALADLSQVSTTAYSVSLIGKEATIAQSKNDGTLESIRGIVEGVTLYNGSAEIIIEGNRYPLSSVMLVKQPNVIIPQGSVTSNNVTTEE